MVIVERDDIPGRVGYRIVDDDVVDCPNSFIWIKSIRGYLWFHFIDRDSGERYATIAHDEIENFSDVYEWVNDIVDRSDKKNIKYFPVELCGNAVYKTMLLKKYMEDDVVEKLYDMRCELKDAMHINNCESVMYVNVWSKKNLERLTSIVGYDAILRWLLMTECGVNRIHESYYNEEKYREGKEKWLSLSQKAGL